MAAFHFLGEEPKRIDVFLAEVTSFTRSFCSKKIENGEVKVNGETVSKNRKLKYGDTVETEDTKPQPYKAEGEDIPLDVVYEDSDLLVVNKPKGMVVHPAAGNYSGTLVNALIHHCGDSLSGINGVMRPGILHRIDKNTSGLLIVAKNDNAHNFLSEQIKAHSFTREYRAVVYGHLKEDSGTVSAPIGRHPVKRKQMAVTVKNSKAAVTHYRVLFRGDGFDYVALRLETGRTHQIRVHMAYLGHPVAGDDVYGPRNVIKKLSGQCLHAGKIGFIHPTSKEYMEFESDLPEYFKDFLEEIGYNGEDI